MTGYLEGFDTPEKRLTTRHSNSIQTDFGRGPHWLHESPFLPPLWENTQDVGAPSLKHAAMRTLLSDQSALKTEHFMHVPWLLALYLWDCLKRWQALLQRTLPGYSARILTDQSDKQTLYMWKIMSEAYPEHFRSISSHFQFTINTPQEPLKPYIEMMNSDCAHWKAVLALSATHATTADLVAIANLKNLVALDIFPSEKKRLMLQPDENAEGKGIGLTDRIVRSWLDVAETAGSLQQLRILRLSHQLEFTANALDTLEKLPNLQLLIIVGASRFSNPILKLILENKGKKDAVRVRGWIARKSNQTDTLYDPNGLTLECVEIYNQVMKADGTSDNNHRDQGCPLLGSDIPIMELNICPISHNDSDYFRSAIHFTRLPKQETKRGPPSSRPEILKRQGKRVMKDRPGRDIGDVLGEFL